MSKKALKQPPVILVKIVIAFANFLQKLRNAILPPEVLIMDYSINAMVTQHSVKVVAELGIADLLKNKTLHIAELAKATQTNETALYRLLRNLTCLGVFKELPNRYFETNRYGRTLETDKEEGLLTFVNFVGAKWHHEQWPHLKNSIENNQDLYQNLYNKSYYEWYDENPEKATVFNEGMIGLSAISDRPIAAAYNFKAHTSILDIAGGEGGQLGTILGAYPHLKGGLFELPSVINSIDNYPQLSACKARVSLIEGDFFKSKFPDDYDIYFMKSIIHNWNDEQAIQILTHVRKAMHHKAKLLLAEAVLTTPNKYELGKLLDIGMLCMTGGLERTQAEYTALFTQANLKLTRVIATASPYSIIEAVPV